MPRIRRDVYAKKMLTSRTQWWQRWTMVADRCGTQLRLAILDSTARPRRGRAIRMGDLEPRILYSATPIEMVGTETQFQAQPNPLGADVQENAATDSIDQVAQPAPTSQVELVIIDSSVSDIQQWLDDLDASSRNLEVIILDSDRDGVTQISEVLDRYSDVAAIHLVSHAEDGAIRLGNGWLGTSNLDGYASELAWWQTSLGQGADLLIYGCDLAATQEGQELVESLAALTGADVAASDDATGHASYGGDWQFEFQVGSIQTTVAPSSTFESNWLGKLATITVDHFDDEVSDNGLTSLREAIIAANSAGGGSTIILAAGTYTLDLSAGGNEAARGDLDITSDLTIVGAGMGQTFIVGDHGERVFHIDEASVYLSDLTIQGGRENDDDGGGIYIEDSSSALILERVSLSNNMAERGAAIYNEGTLTLNVVSIIGNGDGSTMRGGGLFNRSDAILNQVLIQGNQADDGAGIFHDGNSSTMQLINVTVTQNVASDEGGGLHSDADVTIVSSTFTQNVADEGGGIFRHSKSVEIKNSIVSGNLASSDGADVQGNFDSLGFNLIEDTHGAVGFIASDITGQSAMLEGLADNGGPFMTHALAVGSPAINAGKQADTQQVDSRGYTITDGLVDIGAFQNSAALLNRLYWIDESNGKIQSANLDGSDVTDLVTGLSSPDELIVDSIGEKIYWTESGAGAIRRANLDGSDVEFVFTGLNSPQDIFIDSNASKIYWTEDAPSGTDRVRRANLSGTEMEILAESGFSGFDDVELDIENQQVYWSDQVRARIERVNFDGTGREVIYTAPFGNPINGISLDLENGHIYWTRLDIFGAGDDGIWRVDLDGDNPQELVEIGGDIIDGIVIDHANSRMYWTNTSSSTIGTATLSGGSVTTLAVGPIGNPKGIAIGASFTPIVAANQAPSADAGGPYVINQGDSLTLNGAASSDPDLDTLSFQWDLNGNGIFGEAGEPTTESPTLSWSELQALSIDSIGTTTIGLRVDDGNGQSAIATTTTLTIHNVGPTFTSPATASVPENSTGVMTVVATDPVDTVTYSITGGSDLGAFVLNPSSGALRFDTAPDFDLPHDSNMDNVYEVIVTASDGQGGTASQTLSITVSDVNETLISALPDQYSISEDQAYTSTNAMFEAGWTTSRTLSFHNASQTQNLVDLPVLIRLDATRVDYSQTQDAGQDVRFLDSAGNVLAHEIQSWDESGSSYVWVRVPSVAGGSLANSIGLYYGNAAAADGQNTQGVWDGEHRGVYHFDGGLVDSTSFDNDGANLGSTIGQGFVGSGQSFDGTDSGINLGSDASIDDLFAGGGTVSAWIHPESWGENGFGRIIDRADGVVPSPNGWSLALYEPDQTVDFQFGFSGGFGRWRVDANSISLDQWQHIAVVFNSDSPTNDPTFYINGVVQNAIETVTPTGTATSDAGLDLWVGNRPTSNRTFDGQMDELRLINDSRSADEIAAGYLIDTDNFVRFGPARTSGGVLDNDVETNGSPITVTLGSITPSHAATFELRADGSFDYTPQANFSGTDTFTYIASNSSETSPPVTVTINVAPVNDRPEMEGLNHVAIDDDQSAAIFSAATIMDVEGDNVTVQIGLSMGNANGGFTATSLAASGFTATGTGTYELSSSSVADAQAAMRELIFAPTENQVAVGGSVVTTVTVTTDDGLATDVDTFEVTVNSVNDAPSAITFVGGTVDENVSGATMGTLGFQDPDTGDNHVWSTTDSRFEVVGNQLRLAAGTSLDHEAAQTVTVIVTVADGSGARASRSLAINVGDVNEGPTSMTLDNNTVNSDEAGAVVGNMTVLDPDDGDTINWDVDDARFEVVAGELKLKAAESIASATDTQVTLLVTATDGDGESVSRSFTVDVNQPLATLTLVNLPDNVLPPLIGRSQTSATNNQTGGDAARSETSSSESLETSEETAAASTETIEQTSGAGQIARAFSSDSEDEDQVWVMVNQTGDEGAMADSSDADGDPIWQEALVQAVSTDVSVSTGSSSPSSVDQDRAQGGQGSFQSSTALTFASADFALMSRPGPMWNELNQQRDLVESKIQGDLIVVGAAGAAASSVTVGVVAWMLRTGVLASGLIAQLPAWRAFDPLLIMQNDGQKTDNESLEELMSRRSEALDQEGETS